MINKRYITQWLEKAPWPKLAQVEQDLIISRALIELFGNSKLKNKLVFRGGTALNKLFFNQRLRYSEDIDLVQYESGPIGDLMKEIRLTLDPWLGTPKYKQSHGRVTFYYRFETEHEPVRTMKLKVEINTREHGSILEVQEIPFQIENGWFSGIAQIKVYALEELIGTKLRALYQRSKGRDLFDLYQVLKEHPHLETQKTIHCFQKYLENDGLSISRAEFEENMADKLKKLSFSSDILPLLPATISYHQNEAYKHVHEKLISQIPGDAWNG